MESVLEREGELSCNPETKTLLLSMSRSTIDRVLKIARYSSPKGISTTKLGTLLKKMIPVHTWHEWDETIPGFIEMDLVAHCYDNAAGQFIYALTAVDVATRWTECLAIPNKTQIAVSNEIRAIRLRLPFPLLGIDCDNGSGFIHDRFYGDPPLKKKLLSHALDRTKRMFRLTLSRKTGLLSEILSVMIGL